VLEQKYIGGDTAVKIASSVEQAVTAAKARAGDLLPPVRSVAAALAVSPATVAAAWRLLRDRGIVMADGRRGTRIRPASPVAPPPAPPPPPRARHLAEGNPDPALLPDLGAFARRLKIAQRLYGGALNDPGLLAIAARHFDADRVPSEHLAVTSGALDGVERVLREHLRPGDRVIVEDPCFTGIADLLASLALVPVPVAIDDEGFVPPRLAAALKRNAAAIVVTPRAQNPTGAAMTTRRARAIRTLLQHRPAVLLVEDDHAGVVAGAAYETLVSPTTAHWAVIRSVSKSLGPDLRVALVAGDETTIARVEGRQTLGIRWVSHVLQKLVAAMLRDRAVARLLDRAARVYAERRDDALAALRVQGIAAHGASGLNLWIPVADEIGVVQALLQRGWAVQAGSRYRLATPPAIRVTTAALGAGDARRFAADLAAAVAPRRRVSTSGA